MTHHCKEYALPFMVYDKFYLNQFQESPELKLL